MEKGYDKEKMSTAPGRFAIEKCGWVEKNGVELNEVMARVFQMSDENWGLWVLDCILVFYCLLFSSIFLFYMNFETVYNAEPVEFSNISLQTRMNLYSTIVYMDKAKLPTPVYEKKNTQNIQ